MKRRDIIKTSGMVGVVGLGGCLSASGNTDLGTFKPPDGLIAENISSTPNNSPVITYSESEISSNSLIDSVTLQAIENQDGNALLLLPTEKDKISVRDALKTIPRYSGNNGPNGYYIKRENHIILLYGFYKR